LIVYADASALVKRYVNEPESAETLAVLGAGTVLATSVISRVEVGAALARAVRLGRLTRSAGRRAQRAFDREWEDVVRLPLSGTVVARAVDLAWSHGLRGYDAVQLASALEWQQTAASEPVVLATFDRQLAEASLACGLNIWPIQQS
jgi:predicted nucleic acid-binding protein